MTSESKKSQAPDKTKTYPDRRCSRADDRWCLPLLLAQQDISKEEQDTGKNAEDLTEAELETAMDGLGIQDMELTPEDEAAIDAEAVKSFGFIPS